MGKMSIMGQSGDTKLEWDPDNKAEVEQAEESFKDYIKQGFQAFRLWDDGRKGKLLTEFDKFAERILMVPRMAGG